MFIYYKVFNYISNQYALIDNLVQFLLYFFFFSSRRRHTRLQGDWSSDVCSSDLRRAGERPMRAWPAGATFRLGFPRTVPVFQFARLLRSRAGRLSKKCTPKNLTDRKSVV